MYTFRYTISLLAALLLLACSTAQKRKREENRMDHAQRFIIEEQESYQYVKLLGNKNNLDTTSFFVLSNDTSALGMVPRKYTRIQTPCRRMVVLSSIYAAMLHELGCLNNVVAIDNGDYLVNSDLRNAVAQGRVAEVAKGPEPDVEKIVQLQPDVIFMFGMGNGGDDVPSQLKRTTIPIVVSTDHLETSPLSRAEWLKLFAAFAGKSSTADTIFSYVKKRYERLRDSAKFFSSLPLVFTEMKVGEAWYTPGGKSNMATLLQDAAARYPWSENKSAGSLPLSFEQVYTKAGNADFWLNIPLVKSKKELTGHDMRYSYFKAFKTGQLYNNNKVTNALGYSTYWETGMYHPERILSDLILIFHNKGLLDSTQLYYYRRLQ
jgi:iron complex transport system substrate-binding protein